MELNEEQRLAANFTDGICAVIAVPGSGKTKTMMERIGLLVKQHKIPPENILGLTFTRNAAEEMRSRLVPVLGDMASRVTLSTIHSFCYQILKSEGRVFQIFYGKDQIIFLKNILKQLNYLDLGVGMVLREISLAKNNLITVNEFRQIYQGDETMEKVAHTFECYEIQKAKEMKMDFDDLLVQTHQLLQEDQDVLDKYRTIFQHLLVDEYQDTNPAQLSILKLLIGSDTQSKSFWCCGDDAQSIYSFTGASVGNILHFNDMFPESKQFLLTLNYRSSPQILQACHNLIKHNEKQIHKDLKPYKSNGENVILIESATEESEAIDIVNEIMDLADRKGYKYNDIAVLYRANFQSRVIEEAFLKHKIPYTISNGTGFYERFEVKCLLDYMQFITDPQSEAGEEALANILNIPNRYISKKMVSEFLVTAKLEKCSVYEVLKKKPHKLPYIRRNIREFISFVEPLIKEAENLTPPELIELLRNGLDYDRFISDEDIPSPDDTKIANINQLQLASCRYNNISPFLHFIDTFKEENVNDEENNVSLMTIHKSKGLEFPVVFLIGMVEGLMPSNKSSNIEEERRICFVGLSRAMEQLYLSYSQNYQGQQVKKSIFIDEIFDN